MPQDDVLFQTFERIPLTREGCLREDLGGLLERRRGDEAVRIQGGLRYSEEKRCGARRPSALGQNPFVLLLERESVDDASRKKIRIPYILTDPNTPHHRGDDHFHVFVVDLLILGTVDRLDLVEQVVLGRLLTFDPEDVMGNQRALTKPVSGLHAVARMDRQMFPLGDQVVHLFPRLLVCHRDSTLAPLAFRGQIADAIDLANDRRLFGLPGLKDLCDTRQAAGDILSPADFSRGLGQKRSGRDIGSIFRLQMGLLRDGVVADSLATLILDDDLRMEVPLVLHDHLTPRSMGVDFFLHRDVIDDIFVPDTTSLLGDDRDHVGVPLRDQLAALHTVTVVYENESPMKEGVSPELAPLLVFQRDITPTVKNHVLSFVVPDDFQTVESECPGGFRLDP